MASILKAVRETLPPPARIATEVFIVLGGVLGAAFIISQFPALQQFVQSNSVTVKNSSGEVVF
jgi:hypothetical protein